MHPSSKIIAADMPLLTSQYPVRPLLAAFERLAANDPDVRLALTGRRHPEDKFSIWNFLDERGLVDRVDLRPYYDRCKDFPIKKRDCTAWIGRDTPSSLISADYLRRRLAGEGSSTSRLALFFTSFHPEKLEGNSTGMRLWLEHLRRAGYKVHVVYYMYDVDRVTAGMRRASMRRYDLYREVPVRSKLVGANQDRLNVHVDDWCGAEALDAVEQLTATYEYDLAIVNYSFMSAVFDRVASYTHKILFTHDDFADRNRRMIAQGYPESGWVSLDARGEALACSRADTVVATQDSDLAHFRALCDDPSKVIVVGTHIPRAEVPRPAPAAKLRVGYMGSSNWVNERNLAEYLEGWSKNKELREGSEIVIAGGVCDTLKNFVSPALLKNVAPQMLGRVGVTAELFMRCDVAINPERGGSGIKVKTLEGLAHGVPMLLTRAGSIGIGCESKYHLASSIEELVELTAEVCRERARVSELREESGRLYARYEEAQRGSLARLLGPAEAPGEDDVGSRSPERPPGSPAPEMIVPGIVRKTCDDYHLEEFRTLLKRVDVRGCDVLEIGSDYHLASARLFLANGASSVVATNLWDWKSDEPLPKGLEFRACDVASADFGERRFDVVYGIAVLEHLPDPRRAAAMVKRHLKPNGIAYLQGCPLWPGSLGHHLYFEPVETKDQETSARPGGAKTKPLLYSFNGENPIPDWAHLVLSPNELEALLIGKDVPRDHARGIADQVYNRGSALTGSCSNFLSASHILEILRGTFAVDVERTSTGRGRGEYYQRARAYFSDDDLHTIGMRVWLKHKQRPARPEPADRRPLVSLIVPFYNVEPYFDECLRSIQAQDYDDLEVLLVDDHSPDGSREIAQRYAASDGRFRIITHDRNRGLGPARNSGAEHASGRYLLFLDSDDLLSSPTSVSALVSHAEARRACVVAGSCQRLEEDGRISEFDRMFDRSHGGRPGEFANGLDAFLGAMFIPGGRYMPMRAWGILVDRLLYEKSGLSFPATPHEDLPHIPFLYAFAGSALYVPEIVISYRQRAASISNSSWGPNTVRRYAGLWDVMRENVVRFGLQRYLGDTAIRVAEHLIMKLCQNGLQRGAEAVAIEVLHHILSDAKGALNEDLFFATMDSLRSVLALKPHDHDLFRRLTASFDSRHLIRYYRARLEGGAALPGPLPLVDGPGIAAAAGVVMASEALPSQGQVGPAAAADLSAVRTAPVPHAASADDLAVNEARVASIMADFNRSAAKEMASFPAMLSEGDKAIYYHAARNFQFRGSIVDAGCFVGGTTKSLVLGLRDNPLSPVYAAKLEKLIRVYDLFAISEDYIREHLRRGYPGRDFTNTSSFLDLFKENLSADAAWLDVRPGDVTSIGYPDDAPIEVLGVDFCKALAVTDHMLRRFSPRLLPGALVIHQDFIHEFHPHIHLSMCRLADHFERYVELRWGGSVAYRLTKPITTEVLFERFGPDSSWYDDVTTNASALRRLANDMHYDENRWIIMLTLGIYYWGMKDQAQAHEVYQEARSRYPNWEPHEATRQMLGAVKS